MIIKYAYLLINRQIVTQYVSTLTSIDIVIIQAMHLDKFNNFLLDRIHILIFFKKINNYIYIFEYLIRSSITKTNYDG